MSTQELQTCLVAVLDRHDALAVAVSGGVDSMTLAYLAHRFSSARVTIVHAVSPAVPAEATCRVKAYAAAEGWDLQITEAGEFADPGYLANPVNRCYFCKSNLYDRIRSLTDAPIASGANLDDLSDYRPGLLAASEREVVHPYIEAGIDKPSVYELARSHRLSDLARLPAQPCLSSRIETGIPISADDLAFIELVESRVRSSLAAPATVRCRVTRQGIVVETGAEAIQVAEAIASLARALCAEAGRKFLGVRPYSRGSAFIHPPAAHPPSWRTP